MHNILLITIESLRSDRIHSFGYPGDITPNIDKLVNSGTSFNNAFATSTWTPASITSILTSNYSLSFKGCISPLETTTSIAQVLRNAGFRTGAFNSGAWLSSPYYARGFEKYHYGTKKPFLKIYDKFLNISEKFGLENQMDAIYRRYKRARSHFDRYFLEYQYSKNLNKLALSWVKYILSKNNNFFLWIHYPDTHEPYFITRRRAQELGLSFREILELNEKAMYKMGTRKKNDLSLTNKEKSLLSSLYDECILDVDEQIGFHLDVLKKFNVLDDTYVIVTSDHAQQFFEHGEFGHDLYVYDEVVNVPLIFSGPGITFSKHSHMVSLLDLAPTIFDLIGIPNPRFRSIGQNLLREKRKFIFIEDSRRKRNDFKIIDGKVFVDTRWLTIGCRTNRWKYIYNANGKDELYDLLKDPHERQNIVDTKNQIAEQLKLLVIQHLREKEKRHRTMYKINLLRGKSSFLARKGDNLI